HVHVIEIQQLLIETGNRGRTALIVVINELDRSAEQAPFGIDGLLPDLLSEQGRVAAAGEPSSLRDCVADLDWRARLGEGRRRGERESCRGENPCRNSGERPNVETGNHAKFSGKCFLVP